jgi:glycogen debranching enzyme
MFPNSLSDSEVRFLVPSEFAHSQTSGHLESRHVHNLFAQLLAYHNGGIWPFVGGLWVRYVHKLGLTEIARREMVKLANLCAQGIEHEWEFNEWHHGVTGRPMGKAYQAWSAASFIQACHDLNLNAAKMEHNE